MAKTKQRTEFGDFQTPVPLAEAVCDVLQRRGSDPASVVEPTCGQGNLLLAALDRFPNLTAAVGLDVNGAYLASLQTRLNERTDGRTVKLLHGDFFTTDWASLLAELAEPLLVIGNPPWVTAAELGALGSDNLPAKSNFQKHAGLDAITGKSNFDISEWMLIRLMETLNGRSGTLAMLCKTAVARKCLFHAWKNDFQLDTEALYGIDSARHFGASVDACLLVCDFRRGGQAKNASVFLTLDAERSASNLGWRGGRVVADVDAFDRWTRLAADETDCTYMWRSGVKHDCSRVMELRAVEGCWRNKLGDSVALEPTYLYPMLKSSDVAAGRTDCPANWMLVTQSAVNEATETIGERAPKTWAYLMEHAELLDGRRSSIYRKRPRFSVFGVGDYTFAPYKVAISGLYKKLQFQVVGGYQGKPVVFDDTVYFLACQARQEAELLASLLHSAPAREFYSALIFWDSKRPITVDVLRRLDLWKLAGHFGHARDLEQFGIRKKRREDMVLSKPRSDRAYPVRYLPQAKIIVDGRADEPDWALAHVESRFVFPWKQATAPWTEFRALYDEAFLYFAFCVHDEDVVVLDTLRDKQDVVLEDRVEMFFSRDDQMSEYYAMEIDPLGRTYDYRGAYYRQFDPAWTWPGLETKGTLRKQGYEVEGRIPLASFESLGFPRLHPGVKIRCGLYRAEFSHDRSGRTVVQEDSMHAQGRRAEGPPPIEDWISWIDPGTPQPDFHVPASLGWLQFVDT